jgi:hypothetical protein
MEEHMKLIFGLLFSLLIATSAFAKDVLFINGGSPTGTNSVYAREIINQLQELKFSVDLKTTNSNCALAKNLWDFSDKPTIFVMGSNDGTGQRNNAVCFIEATRQNLLYWLNTSPMSFCSAGSKTWFDFVKPGSSHTVITMPNDSQEKFIHDLAKSFDAKVKTIRVYGYNDALTMVKAGDVDFVFRVGIHVTSEFKDKCFWNHAEIDSMFPNMQKSRLDYMKFGEQMFLISKGFSQSEIQSLRLQIRNTIRSSEEIKKLVLRRGQTVYDWNSVEEHDKIIEKFFQTY